MGELQAYSLGKKQCKYTFKMECGDSMYSLLG